MAQVRTWRWVRLLSALAAYAVAFWGGVYAVGVVAVFLDSHEIPHTDTASLILFGALLIGAFVLIYRLGVWVGSRLWVASPVLVVILPAFCIPVLGQRYLGWPSDPGWVFAIIAACIYALVALLPAALGIQRAFDLEEAPPYLDIADRNPRSWAVPVTLAGTGVLVLGLVSGTGIGVVVGLILFVAGAIETGAWKHMRIWP